MHCSPLQVNCIKINYSPAANAREVLTSCLNQIYLAIHRLYLKKYANVCKYDYSLISSRQAKDTAPRHAPRIYDSGLFFARQAPAASTSYCHRVRDFLPLSWYCWMLHVSNVGHRKFLPLQSTTLQKLVRL